MLWDFFFDSGQTALLLLATINNCSICIYCPKNNLSKLYFLLTSINNIFDKMYYTAVHYLHRSTFSQNYNLLMLIDNTIFIISSLIVTIIREQYYNYYITRGYNINILFFGQYIHMSQLLIVANNNCEGSGCVCVLCMYIYIYIQGVPQKCILFLYYLYLQLKLRYFKSVYFIL